ncbi:hypothetical protein M8J77_015037 [Diaphorina citri]|nr:hypothetical protein M8J77_015037 [Diaphorina citri]
MTKLQAICFHLLYELSDEPKRKEFLDDLFSFNQKKGVITPKVLQQPSEGGKLHKANTLEVLKLFLRLFLVYPVCSCVATSI